MFVLWRLLVLQKLAARRTVVTQVTIFLSCGAKLVKLSIANCLYIVVVVLHLKLFNKEPFSGMLLKRGMGNGEWGMGNGEWGIVVSGNT